MHCGSQLDPDKVRKAIEMMNAEKPDIILFTGDMVNKKAEEMHDYMPLLRMLQAPDGKLSVLGNHDYGMYVKWDSDRDRLQNLETLIAQTESCGFRVLRNAHHKVEKNGESLYILGVENWGIPPFPQYGDLDKALYDVPADAAKVLMSHDPTHFDEVVKHHPVPVALTLSGHTHGMQFGIDLQNIKWSPVQYKYPKWVDLYESMGKYLYVNRGFSVLGLSARIGVWPEITVLELKRKQA